MEGDCRHNSMHDVSMKINYFYYILSKAHILHSTNWFIDICRRVDIHKSVLLRKYEIFDIHDNSLKIGKNR